MHYTLEKLLAGEHEVANHYRLAAEFWEEFYRDHASETEDEWAKLITMAQIMPFEHNLGGRLLGQEVMAWSALAVLYTTQAGFDNNKAVAIKVVKAFAKSMVSLEVKFAIRKAALSYHLEEEAELVDVLKYL